MKHKLSNAQFGSRSGRGSTDAIFLLWKSTWQLGERAIELDQDLVPVFINQEKSFDRVDREKLWVVMEDCGAHGELLDCIRALYADSKGVVTMVETLNGLM